MGCDYYKLYTIYYLAETKAERKFDVKPLSEELLTASMKRCMSFTPEETLAGMKDIYSPGGLERQNRISYDALEAVAKAWEQKTFGRAEARRPVALISPATIREEFAPGMPAAVALSGLFPPQPTQDIQPLSAPKKAIALLKRAHWDLNAVMIGGVFLLGVIALIWYSRI
jgi:hypothetical protein